MKKFLTFFVLAVFIPNICFAGLTYETTNSAIIFHATTGHKQGDRYVVEGGLYITNLKVKENLNYEKSITFDVYNTKDAVGIVEYYDENGKFIGADQIKPQNVVIKDFDSWWEKAKNTFDAIEKYGFWRDKPITHPFISKHTPIEAPKGTYTILVTNNQTKSIYLLMHNVVDHIFKEIKLVKNLNALLKSYDAFDKNSTSDKVIDNVKEKWTTRMIHTLQENYKNMIDSGKYSKSEFKYKIGSDLTMKLGEQEIKNDVLQHFDLQKALEETTEYVIKNSGKIALEEGRVIATKIVDGLLNGNPAIVGFKGIDLVGISLDTLSKFMNEKYLEKAKPMIFYFETSSDENFEIYSDNETVPSDALSYNGHYYKIYNAGMTWNEAKKFCERFGGHLVTITSQDEQNFVQNLVANYGTKNSYWLGGHTNNSGQWYWVTDEPFSYSNWLSGQPDNYGGVENAMMMYKNTTPFNNNKLGDWNDLNSNGNFNNERFFGTQNFGFICEWDNFEKNIPMIFSQPVYIGEALPHYQREAYGLFIKNATYNNGSYYREFIKDNSIGYGKGTAKFDTGSDEIYFFFDYHLNAEEKSTFKFGSNDIKNTVECLPGRIQKIKTNSGITFYEIAYFVYRISASNIIAKHKDGKWIKYIDTVEINKDYFGKNLRLDDCPIYHQIKCEGDTIIMQYSFLKKSDKGEFRFKWDDAAQNFKIEQIKY